MRDPIDAERFECSGGTSNAWADRKVSQDD